MINLIQNTAQKILDAHNGDINHCGVLTSPLARYDMNKVAALGMKWAMDNGCFVSYEPKAIVSLMRKNQGIEGCLFMVAPDVVQKHEETLKLFWQWEGIIASYGYRIAFVLQNGVTLESVPFAHIDAVFIGGDDNFKGSKIVRDIVKKAKSLGLWVHNGRVNTKKRIRYSQSIACDSFDGTSYSMFLNTSVEKHYSIYSRKQLHFLGEWDI